LGFWADFGQEPVFRGIILVALTGWGSAEDKLRSKEAGFDFHLTKPVEVDAVEGVLAQFSIFGKVEAPLSVYAHEAP